MTQCFGKAREAAGDNPAPEHLPLLEMYRRYHAAARAGEPTEALAENIDDLEAVTCQAIAPPQAPAYGDHARDDASP